MAAVPVATWLTLAASAGATYASVRSSRNAAKATEIQYEEQAKDEASAARDRELERRRRLVSALSSQAASAGAAGIDQSVGTRKAIAINDIKASETENVTDAARSNRRSRYYRQAGSNAAAQSDLQAAGTVLNTAGSYGG